MAYAHKLLQSLVNYLGCGNIYNSSRSAVSFHVTKFKDVLDIIIPLFAKYPQQGIKILDYLDFLLRSGLANLIKNKLHKTAEGLANIRQIKAGMRYKP
jgi:transcriptional regulator